MTLQEYLVRIEYREPTYELATRKRSQPFRWTCRIKARSPAGASALAVEQFRAAQRLSSVGWLREIECIEVVEIEPE